MKIVLQAFGGLLVSKPMDVPESTLTTFRMVLDGHGYNTMCEFEFAGKFVGNARLYNLTSIEKIR